MCIRDRCSTEEEEVYDLTISPCVSSKLLNILLISSLRRIQSFISEEYPKFFFQLPGNILYCLFSCFHLHFSLSGHSSFVFVFLFSRFFFNFCLFDLELNALLRKGILAALNYCFYIFVHAL